MKLSADKKYLVRLTPLFLIFGIFFIGYNAHADWAVDILSGILSIFIWALGLILVLVIKGLVLIASYQHFIDSQAVILGWVIVRDICNMFFVVILMIIAFGTILHLEDYNYKKWLPKLILMAVLINFSKTICGLLIDITQVVMLTFVNAFKDIGGANLTEMLGITKIVQISGSAGDVSTVVGAYVLGMIYLIVAIIVIVTMAMMLAMRLVMIWIYVVLSPAAYLMSAFPGGQKYASQWWSEFIKNLIVGPVLAFFIWLSLAALSNGNNFTATIDSANLQNANNQAAKEGSAVGSGSINGAVAGSEASTPGSLIQFIVAIGMLVGGLMVTQQIGGAAGSMAGKGMSAIQKGQGLALKGAKKIAMGDNYLARKTAKAIGWDFRPVKIKESLKAFAETSKKKDEQEIRDKAQEHFEHGGLRSVAMGMGVGEDYFHRYADGFLGVKGINRARKEVFSSQSKRRELREQIDANEADTKKHQEDKFNLEQSKKPEIEERTNQKLDELAKNGKYTRLSDEEKDKITRFNEQDVLTDEEKGELNTLQIKEGRAKRIEDKVRKEATAETFAADPHFQDLDLKIKINEQSLENLKQQMIKVQTPVAFEARSAYRKSVEEAKSKYKSITNSDELQKAYDDAEQRGDKYDMIAIGEKMSGDANLNELLRARGYDSNAKGLHAYAHDLPNYFGVNNGLKGKFSAKERTKIENDLGESEERVGHWEMAKMAGVNAKGELESYIKEMRDANGKIMKDKNGRIMYDDSQHAIHAYAEVIKFDPQKIVNSMNRLAMGGENGAGQFEISNLGLMIFKFLASAGAYEKNSGRILGNTAANLISGNNEQLLKRVMADQPEKGEVNIKLMHTVGGSPSGNILAGNAYANIKATGLHLREQG